jgi:V/A-type H+-transporting ATPase subunit D
MPKPRKKIKFTWAELKHQRNALQCFQLYLPTLQLKQQQLRMKVMEAEKECAAMERMLQRTEEEIDAYRAILKSLSGINVRALSEPEKVKTHTRNIAGVTVPVLQSIDFPQIPYSLFGTPPWVDRAVKDLRRRSTQLSHLQILRSKEELLRAELARVTQRVNLFEKVIIPETQGNIRRIRIALGDAMSAAVARAKMAKARLEKTEHERESMNGRKEANCHDC